MNLHVPDVYGGAGLSAFDGMLVGEELNWGCSGIADLHRGERPRRGAGADRRHGRAEGPVAAAAARGADPLLLRAQRARCRLGRRAAADDRRPQGRRVRPQRLQDVHHQRGARRPGRSSSPRRTRRRAIVGCPRSSSRWTRRAWRSRSTWTRWASGRRTPRRSRSRTSSSPPPTGWVRRATDSRSR